MFGSLRGSFESRHGPRVVPDIQPGLPAEGIGEVLHDEVVEVLAPQVGVASGGAHLELEAIADREDGHVEGTAPQVKDEHVPDGPRLDELPIGESRCGGLVQDTQDVQAGDYTGVFRCLSLRVVEVGRDLNPMTRTASIS